MANNFSKQLETASALFIVAILYMSRQVFQVNPEAHFFAHMFSFINWVILVFTKPYLTVDYVEIFFVFAFPLAFFIFQKDSKGILNSHFLTHPIFNS